MCWGLFQATSSNTFPCVKLRFGFFVFKLKLHWYFARNGSVNDMASLIGTMAWHTSGAKPLSRANGGIVYWRIKGVTMTRWLNVNKLINVVAFRVGSAIMIVNEVHALKLSRSFTHAINWSSQSVVGFRSREMPSNLSSWNEINQLLWSAHLPRKRLRL